MSILLIALALCLAHGIANAADPKDAVNQKLPAAATEMPTLIVFDIMPEKGVEKGTAH